MINNCFLNHNSPIAETNPLLVIRGLSVLINIKEKICFQKCVFQKAVQQKPKKCKKKEF